MSATESLRQALELPDKEPMNRRRFLLASVAGLLFAGRALSDDPRRLRVLSYNIHHGEGTDGKIDLERIARVITGVKPDLVALQEVDRGVKRTKGIDEPAELARLTQMKAVFERNITYQGGDYGNAVLSRLPVQRHKNHALPSLYQGEQRGVLEVEVTWEGRPLLFLATHLDYRPNDAERRASVERIEEVLKDRRDVPVILAGDLNATPESEVLKMFRKNWQMCGVSPTTWTYPAAEPKKQIDYVLARPAQRWKTVEVRVLQEPVASDHRPILAVLELQS